MGELNVAGELKRRQRSAASRSTSSERRNLWAERRDQRAQSVTICELKVAIGELRVSRSSSSEHRDRRALSVAICELRVAIDELWASPLSFNGDGSRAERCRWASSATVGFFVPAWFFFFFWPKCLGWNVLWIAGLKCFVDSWEFFSSLILPYSDKRIFLTNTIHYNTYYDEIFRH